MSEATHEITACYFPRAGEVELTWRDLQTGEEASLETKVTPKQGEAIARTVMACVYSQATATAPARSESTADKLRALVRYQKAYPADVVGQQAHFGKLPSEHASFEAHLEQTFTVEELKQLRESICAVLGDEPYAVTGED